MLGFHAWFVTGDHLEGAIVATVVVIVIGRRLWRWARNADYRLRLTVLRMIVRRRRVTVTDIDFACTAPQVELVRYLEQVGDGRAA